MARDVLPQDVSDVMGLPTQADIEESRKRDAPLMATGAGRAGNVLGNVAAAVPAAMVPGAGTYLGASAIGATLGAVQPTVKGESRLTNTVVSGALGAVGKAVGGAVGSAISKRLAKRTAELATRKNLDAVKNATLAAAKGEGYVVPPTQANASSAWNQLLEGLSGKIKTAQLASVKNQDVTNRLVRNSLGLADDAPLTKDALQGIRGVAGQAYDDIAQVPTYRVDQAFKNAITKLAKGQRTLEAEIPEIANKTVLSTAEALNKPRFSGETVVELTKSLRNRADQAFASGDKTAGRFFRSASDAVEDLIDRNLHTLNRGDVLTPFRESRRLIAKTYTVEKALNETTGNVIAGKLAAELKRGKPLSGGIKAAARFAHAFPKAAQEVQRTGAELATSPLDWATAAMAASAIKNPLPFLGVAARPSIRSMILSKPYQRTMTNPGYDPSLLLRGSGKVAPALPSSLGVGAPASYFSLSDEQSR